MKINKILLPSLWLPLLCACSSDGPADEVENIRPITIRASLPDGPESRAQITYGNQDVDAGEYFMWDEGDEIFVYNITRLEETPEIYCFDLSSSEGLNAEFTLDTVSGMYPKEFHPKAGDILVATLGTGSIYMNSAEEVDPRKIISLYAGTEENKPQYVDENPTNASLRYMRII